MQMGKKGHWPASEDISLPYLILPHFQIQRWLSSP